MKSQSLTSGVLFPGCLWKRRSVETREMILFGQHNIVESPSVPGSQSAKYEEK